MNGCHGDGFSSVGTQTGTIEYIDTWIGTQYGTPICCYLVCGTPAAVFKFLVSHKVVK